MKHFFPISPDPALKKRKGDGALARFGHLNVLVDKINEFDANQTIAAGLVASPTQLILGLNIVTPVGLNTSVILPCLSELCACSGGCGPAGSVIIKNVGLINLSVYACGTESINGGPGPVTILPGDSLTVVDSSCTSWETINSAAGSPGLPGPPPCVEPVSATEALEGDGTLGNCLSVCIDGTTITKDVNGCLQAIPTLGYAEYVQHTQGSNASVAPGSAILYNGDTPGGVFNTIGITTNTGPGAQGTEFVLPIGTYAIDYENSADAAWSLAIYKSLVTQTEVIDTETISGSSTATTWIHGRAILVAAAQTFIIVSPVVGTQAIPTAGTAAGEFIARITFLKIA